MLKKTLIVLGTGLALVGLGLAAGFRVWLRSQPEDFQATISAMSTAEFLGAVGDQYLPREPVDLGAYGRRRVEGRGHSPWVVRTNLDGEPRMIVFALAPEHWLAVHSPTGRFTQLWRGEVHWEGPAYDTYHGVQPSSSGRAWLRAEPQPSFRVFHEGSGTWKDAGTRYLGQRFEDGGRLATLRYALASPDGEIVLTVAPELRRPESATTSPGVGLEQSFRVESNPAGLRIAVPALGGRLDGVGTTSLGEARGGAGWRELLAAEARLVHWFDQSPTPFGADAQAQRPFGASATAAAVIERSDCLTCHHPQERIVGPSWAEVAARYSGKDRQAAVAALARRVRLGGSGEWGTTAMPGHPEMTQQEAEQIVWAVLETEEPAYAPLPVEVAARERHSWTYDALPGKGPEALHPSVRIRRLDTAPLHTRRRRPCAAPGRPSRGRHLGSRRIGLRGRSLGR